MEIPHFPTTPIIKRIISFNVLREKDRLNGRQGAYFKPSATTKPLTLTGGEFL